MKLITVMCVAFLAFGGVFGNTDPVDVKKAIKSVLDTQVEAWNRGDIEGFMEGYWKSEQMTFVSGNNVSRGWQAALDRYKRGYDTRAKMGQLEFSELEITMLGDDSAMVMGRFTLIREKDRPTGMFTLIFRRIDGQWKVVHDHTSS